MAETRRFRRNIHVFRADWASFLGQAGTNVLRKSGTIVALAQVPY
jgi:hypothetical protein